MLDKNVVLIELKFHSACRPIRDDDLEAATAVNQCTL